MILAFATTNKKTLCDKVGFCKYIMIYDVNTKKTEYIKNPIYEKAIKHGYKDCREHALGTGEILLRF
ncbi:hypothetical protein FE773_05550 [Caminibacter mediatlanticus TB-2]|uniref:Uncharacterized protein n=1 Tax=Caminibacter mediatlanticus TB-2 TaxID=391592 RepID=A0ABX5VCA6_9BACT|nr:hypothetical protein [Caminibacter mediatlanticus]QCT94659.1 hypothetical protein FE773_05550 [Caminibacter mediatlanticus TB-2]